MTETELLFLAVMAVLALVLGRRRYRSREGREMTSSTPEKKTSSTPEKKLTKGQQAALGGVAGLMVGVGGVGAFGTFTNANRAFGEGWENSEGTAAGVVAAGEGATLVLALTMVGLTLLGQSTPLMVRLGLWTLPAVASAVSASMATGLMQTLVYGVTPMAMCVSAEGLGLIARRIVIYRTGVDMEAQRRNASITRKVAFQRALAANHPDAPVKQKALRKSWKLAKRVGVGDDQLGTDLVEVQRNQLTLGAETALAQMLTVPVTADAFVASVGVTQGEDRRRKGVTAVTGRDEERPALMRGETGETTAVTQVSPPRAVEPSQKSVTAPVGETGEAVTESVSTETGEGLEEVEASQREGYSLAEVAAVAGVPVPVPGVKLTDEQLTVVLRYLRYREDPPASYRQAQTAFRDAKFIGGEGRVRRAFKKLLAAEAQEANVVPVPATGEEDEEQDESEEPERRL